MICGLSFRWLLLGSAIACDASCYYLAHQVDRTSLYKDLLLDELDNMEWRDSEGERFLCEP